MSAAEVIKATGVALALVDGKVKLAGLDRLPSDVAERVLNVAREHREELVRELSGASAPGPSTGLEWLPGPPADDGPDFESWWGAFDLADFAKLYGLRVVAASGRVLVLYPPELHPDLVSYAEALLGDAQPYLAARLDKLPALDPAEVAGIIKDVMSQHKGLRFTRGDGGSMWPIYPPKWAACQKQVVQSLWLAAGDSLDHDDFKGMDDGQ
ncbi:hypothetical protein DFW101_0916 [Solidesulfovibrio carbinoliphilus subsp. oakridgensis]|uniref:TubC N-terminal docking domain-containing protein n=1 Tax=Solidesulfovibrio carbinoliphilus subsp. oakridgensis TaxID=694327 RepID=G7Q5Z4_9BACT|nr:hypothetical protein [Solidesulfovibrio carbinoliphilus]EHJ46931.1 hypothetical protein DFW101_0916 [Solidesulfovibrio carbinoliphilus subsp. oakridgensis]